MDRTPIRERTLDVATSSLLMEEGGEGTPPPPRRYEWQRERRRPRPSVIQSRPKPPTQDRLVLVFITAVALFTIITISPFLFGDFASSHYSHDRNTSKRRRIPIKSDANDEKDSHFGVGNLLRLAENRTHLTWQYLTELKKRKQHKGGSMGGIVDLHLAPWENGGEEEEEEEFSQQQQQQQHQQSSSSINGRGYISIIGDNTHQISLHLDRGVSGLPLSKTPALVGARHGTIQCPEDDVTNHNINELAYWNDPQGNLDASFISPFDPRNKKKNNNLIEDDRLTRYVTFEPDRGGWNNIRMSLEIVIVFAAVTGRTLVLPPDTPFYLLSKDGSDAKSGPNGNSRTGKKRHHGFADFLDLDHGALREKLNMISMTEFLKKEGSGGGVVADTLFEVPNGIEGTKIMLASEQCVYVAKSDRPCEAVYDFLRSNAYVPDLQAGRDCLIFDSDHIGVENISQLPTETQAKIADFCGRDKKDARNPILFGGELATSRLVHFHAGEKYHRLLNHFYTFLFFSDVKIDHYYKRFVRDFLHYPDSIFCAAGRVIKLLEEESTKLLSSSSSGGDGPSYSSMHVRRGDFQYKKVKITAQDWYDNTNELFSDGELIFVATDEKNKKFFEPLQKHYNLRFLHDYTHAAGLNEMDPNLMGMIDSIVASRGRLFVGTWFSTFTGYINRMRGYYGYPGSTSYYSTHDRKFNTHQWENPGKVLTAREWPTAWIGIDGDEDVNVEREL